MCQDEKDINVVFLLGVDLRQILHDNVPWVMTVVPHVQSDST